MEPEFVMFHICSRIARWSRELLIVLLLSDHHNSAFNMAFPISFHTFVSCLALFVIIMVGDRYLVSLEIAVQ